MLKNPLSSVLYFLVSFLILSSAVAEVTEPVAAGKKSEDSQPLSETLSQTAQEASENVEKKMDEIAVQMNSSRYYRGLEQIQFGLDFSYLDLVLPGKWGVHLEYNENESSSFEMSYLKGSLSVPFFIDDLGGLTEERFSVIQRKFFKTNSFNLFYGLSYFNFQADLGSEYLQSVSPSQRTHFDVVQLQSFGFQVGFGNRWHLHKNVVLGVDWVSWSQPVFETYRNSDFIDVSDNENSKDNVRKSLSVLSYLPRLSLFKVQLAWSF